MAGNLTLENITIDGKNINAQKPMIDSFANLTIEDGTTIKNGNDYNNKGIGGIYQGEGTITMNGGTITNNKGASDGAIRIANGKFVMNGGSIYENTGKIRGGVQFVKGTFVMNSGSITNNTATESAPGGLNIDYGTFEIHGGTINNNTGITNANGGAMHNIIEWQSGNSITRDYKISPTFTVNTSPTSRYQIVSALDNNKVMSLEENTCNPGNGECSIWLWSNNKAGGQKWMPAVESIVNGKVYYKIYHIGDTNPCLDVQWGETSDGTPIQSYICNSTDGQRFYLENAGDGYYYIKHKTSNKCLDVSNGQTVDGTKIQLYTCNGTPSQKWKFVQITN